MGLARRTRNGERTFVVKHGPDAGCSVLSDDRVWSERP
jgi:hypothetical protein